MSLESDLFTALQANSGLTALIGDRLYRDRLPQGAAYPAVVYQRISTTHAHHMTAASGLAEARIQFDSWATDAASAEAVAEKIRLALQGFRGDLGSTSVRTCHLENTESGYDPPADSSDVAAHRVSQDFMVAYFESVPTF